MIFPMINLSIIPMKFCASLCVWNSILRYSSLVSRCILDSWTTTWNWRQNSFDRKINCNHISFINEASSSLWRKTIEITIHNRCYILYLQMILRIKRQKKVIHSFNLSYNNYFCFPKQSYDNIYSLKNKFKYF